ncbi:hypothetical protein B0H14DRAFT_2678326 [Mycena olivaceomarginata]|nr:hypothetical protein B0H14DRAFT_2678326 [Mycena olivaceomarginata]
MRSLSIPVSSFLLVILLGVVAPASGSPQTPFQTRPMGGVEAGFLPWMGQKTPPASRGYAIRDAIMGGIYHGRCELV